MNTFKGIECFAIQSAIFPLCQGRNNLVDPCDEQLVIGIVVFQWLNTMTMVRQGVRVFLKRHHLLLAKFVANFWTVNHMPWCYNTEAETTHKNICYQHLCYLNTAKVENSLGPDRSAGQKMISQAAKNKQSACEIVIQPAK